MTDDLTELAGVGKATAEKLEEKGYNTFMALAIESPRNLVDIMGEGLTVIGAAKLIESAKDLAKIDDFITANELKEKRKILRKLTTSSPQLDGLFGGGGIETTSIVEFFGEFGSGKTQLCFQLAVNATMPEDQGGLNGHVIVVDTENTFRPRRIEDMAKAHGLDVDETNDKIHIAKAFNAAHQILLIEKKAPELAEKVPVKLVIVDSLVAHFRSEYIGRGNLSERQGLLNKHMHDLLHFAYLHNAAVAVTNQVLTNPALPPFMDPTKPVGGHIIGHTSTYRVYLKKGKPGRSTARMIDSPEDPVSDVVISIGEEGIRDA